MEDLKTIKKILITSVQNQIENLEYVNTHELGEVIDMIKDLEEACYYHTKTESMKNNTYIER